MRGTGCTVMWRTSWRTASAASGCRRRLLPGLGWLQTCHWQVSRHHQQGCEPLLPVSSAMNLFARGGSPFLVRVCLLWVASSH